MNHSVHLHASKIGAVIARKGRRSGTYRRGHSFSIGSFRDESSIKIR